MYEALVARVRYHIQKANFMGLKEAESTLLLAETADAIEELSRENESLAKSVNEASEILRRRWIPVTERLPEPNVVDKYGFAKGYLVKTDRHVMMHTARYNGEWWILWGKAEVITDTVTHWMPLPEPPVDFPICTKASPASLGIYKKAEEGE